MASLPISDSLALPREQAGTAVIPWYVWCSTLAVTSAIVGAHWDISWHTSIGRDTFWTPAHVAIYMCGVLAALSCGYCILSSTFGRNSAMSSRTVRIWGFRGPLGAFIASWGGIAMLTSAPFDDWWHGAYGLDVKIVSPPHVVLFAGAIGVTIGTLILVLGHMNMATGRTRDRLEWLFLYLGAQTVLFLQTLLLEYTNRSHLHTSRPYRVISIFIPFVLAAVAKASGKRFPATLIATYYMLFVIAEILILPLFPAEPKLGPVYHPVSQFIPAQFPVVLVAPALALDLLRQKTKGWSGWKVAILSGLIFTSVLLTAEWPLATFLQSPLARNAFFGTDYMGYFVQPQSFMAQHRFLTVDTGLQFWVNIGWAAVFAAISTGIGLAWGNWMKEVKR
jgi:hypothetical protein